MDFNKFKLILGLIFSFIILGLNSNIVVANTADVNLAVNGKLVTFPDQKPYIDANNRTMVPVRFPAETLGAIVDWKQDTRQVHITNKAHDALKDTDIMTTIDRKDVIVNGEIKYMDTTAVITNSRTMVPVRFISEYLGAVVTWDNGNRVAHVFSKGQTDAQIKEIMDKIAEEIKGQKPVVPGQFVKPEGVKKDITTQNGTYSYVIYDCKNLPVEVYGVTINKIEYKPGTPRDIKGNIAGTLYVTKNKAGADTDIYLQGDFGYYYCDLLVTNKGTSIPKGDGTYYSMYYFTVGRTPSIETVKKIGFKDKSGIYFIDNPYYKQ